MPTVQVSFIETRSTQFKVAEFQYLLVGQSQFFAVKVVGQLQPFASEGQNSPGLGLQSIVRQLSPYVR